MNLKKGLAAGLGAIILAGGAYGISSVYAESNSAETHVQAKGPAGEHQGKRLEFLTQYKDQLHQVNQLREERLDLKKQAIEKKDQLLDLFVAIKSSGDKEKLKHSKGVKQQIKSINSELKTLISEGKDERKALKETVKNGDGTVDFNKIVDTGKQVNEKMKEKLTQLNQLIEDLK